MSVVVSLQGFAQRRARRPFPSACDQVAAVGAFQIGRRGEACSRLGVIVDRGDPVTGSCHAERSVAA
jgi:hypothetical protein